MPALESQRFKGHAAVLTSPKMCCIHLVLCYAAKSRKTKAERVLDNVVREFRQMQEDADRTFRNWEEERWRERE
jgi:hypothetical protein